MIVKLIKEGECVRMFFNVKDIKVEPGVKCYQGDEGMEYWGLIRSISDECYTPESYRRYSQNVPDEAFLCSTLKTPTLDNPIYAQLLTLNTGKGSKVIIFNTRAYVMNDEGKTVETI